MTFEASIQKTFLAVTTLLLLSLTPKAHAGFFDDLIKGSSFNPREIALESVSYAGAGCPQGTVTTILSPDAQERSRFCSMLSMPVSAPIKVAPR